MTSITKTIASFAIAAISFTAASGVALAGEGEVRTFTRDGVKYEYTSKVEGKSEVLRGTADGVPFRLVVRGDYVSGYNGHHPVEFTHRPAKKSPHTDVAVR